MTGGNNYGNRLDNRQRGNASQLLEKYRALARDAQSAGDRVTSEYYLQYAEHYYRVLGDYRDRQGEPTRRPRDLDEEDSAGFNGNDNDENEDADDGGDDGGDEDDNNSRDEERNYRADRSRQQDNRRDEPRQDSRQDNRRDEPRREQNAREQQPRGRDWSGERPQPRRDDSRREEGRREEVRREEVRRDESRRDESRRDDSRRDNRRPQPLRASEEAIDAPIPGLPGPATLTPRSRRQEPVESPPAPIQPDAATLAVDSAAEAEAPAPRRRGRPRKVDV